MPEKTPAYQWYPKDYMSDEHVLMMDLEQEGAYRRLLDHQWLHGSIPSDSGELAAILRVDARRFARIWKRVAPCFGDTGNGRLQNARLEHQRAEQEAFRSICRERASRGASARWQKHQPSNAKAMLKQCSKDARSITQAMLKNASPDSISIDTPSESSSKEEYSSVVALDAPKKPANEPFASIERCLTLVAEQVQGGDPPTAVDVRRHLKESDPLRRLVEAIGAEEAAALMLFAMRTWRQAPTWSAVLNQRNQLKAQMQKEAAVSKPPMSREEARRIAIGE